MSDPYEKWPQYFINASKIDVEELKEPPEKVACVGAGGSGVVCRIMKAFYSFTDDLRKANTLIAISSSGNTISTLNTVREAIDKGIKVVGITRGGKLEKLLKDRNQRVITFNAEGPTRFVFPYLFTILTKLVFSDLVSALLNGAIDGDPQIVNELYEKVKVTMDIYKIPIFYGGRYIGLAQRFKQEFNENAKLPAFYDDIHEIIHNEIEIDYKKFGFVPVVFGGDEFDDNVFEFLKDYDSVYLPVYGIVSIPVLVEGVGHITIRIAKNRNVDPVKTEKIDGAKHVIQG